MPLFYSDGGTFLEIVDRRHSFNVLHFNKDYRDIYLYCAQIRDEDAIVARFNTHHSTDTIMQILEEFVSEHFMFRENGHYLSLAPARTSQHATQHIRDDSAM